MGGLMRVVILVCVLVLVAHANRHAVGLAKHRKQHDAATKALQPKLHAANSSHTASSSSLETLERQLEADVNELVSKGNFRWGGLEEALEEYDSLYPPDRKLEEDEAWNNPTNFLMVLDMGSSGTKHFLFGNQQCDFDAADDQPGPNPKALPNIISGLANVPPNIPLGYEHYAHNAFENVADARTLAAALVGRPNINGIVGIVGGATAGNRIATPANDRINGPGAFLPRLAGSVAAGDANIVTQIGGVLNAAASNANGAVKTVAERSSVAGGHTLPGTEEAWWEYHEARRMAGACRDGMRNFISLGGASMQMGITVTDENYDAIYNFLGQGVVTNHPHFPTEPAGLAGHGADGVTDFVCVRKKENPATAAGNGGPPDCIARPNLAAQCQNNEDCVLLVSWVTGNDGCDRGRCGTYAIWDAANNQRGWNANNPVHSQYFGIGGTNEVMGYDSTQPGAHSVMDFANGAPNVAASCGAGNTAQVCAQFLINHAQSNVIVNALLPVVALSKGDNQWVLYGNQAVGATFRSQYNGAACDRGSGAPGHIGFQMWSYASVRAFNLDIPTWTNPPTPLPANGANFGGNDFCWDQGLARCDWAKTVAARSGFDLANQCTGGFDD